METNKFEKKELTLQLGDRVLFFSNLERVQETVTNPPESWKKYRQEKKWKNTPLSPGWNQSLTGIVIGIRTLQNGILHWDNEAGNLFDPQEYFQAYLISYNLHRKPVFVLPEFLTKLSNKTT